MAFPFFRVRKWSFAMARRTIFPFFVIFTRFAKALEKDMVKIMG
jgi:hypothetical protein